MQFDGINLTVKNIEAQKEFYSEILGLKLVSDYGAAASVRREQRLVEARRSR